MRLRGWMRHDGIDREGGTPTDSERLNLGLTAPTGRGAALLAGGHVGVRGGVLRADFDSVRLKV